MESKQMINILCVTGITMLAAPDAKINYIFLSHSVNQSREGPDT